MPQTESGLECPQSYLDATPAARAAICNGCGSAQAKFDFIPDTIYGMSIKYACWIHDWMYNFGRDLADKREADQTFLENMLTLIERDRTWYRWALKSLMRRRALKYYEAVVVFGEGAFRAGKH